jgi:hypothetical protein
MNLTAVLGVPWSAKKTRLFTTTQRYIGFDWNLDSHSVALPSEKLVKILQLLDYWLQSGQSVSAKEAASLHGKLVHVSCIFPLIWPSVVLLDFLSPSGLRRESCKFPPLCMLTYPGCILSSRAYPTKYL